MVYQKELPIDSFFSFNKEYKVRTLFQVWTIREGMKNLRLKSRPPVRHPDFEMFLHNNTKETLKYFNKKVFKWAFAVPRQGFYDYKERIEDQRRLRENIQWMFFRPLAEGSKERLWKIDYEELAKRNTTIPGFGKADVVEVYDSLWGKIKQTSLC